MQRRIPTVLTIAGSDPSGGAGIQADLKTFAAWHCHGTSVVTALTAQNTRGVFGVLLVEAGFVADQLAVLLDDVRIDAVKIGMLGSPQVARVVAEALDGPLRGVPCVLDPVMVATSGDSLARAGLREAIVALLGRVSLVTPNLPEAACLTGLPQARDRTGMAEQARLLAAPAVLVKGGHLPGGQAMDLLLDQGREMWFSAPRVETRNSHGTGCTLSSAIAANLALGRELPEAVRDAKQWLTRALACSGELDVGNGTGHGPVNHLVPALVNDR